MVFARIGLVLSRVLSEKGSGGRRCSLATQMMRGEDEFALEELILARVYVQEEDTLPVLLYYVLSSRRVGRIHRRKVPP